jgi:hypothetical protein
MILSPGSPVFHDDDDKEAVMYIVSTLCWAIAALNFHTEPLQDQGKPVKRAPVRMLSTNEKMPIAKDVHVHWLHIDAKGRFLGTDGEIIGDEHLAGLFKDWFDREKTALTIALGFEDESKTPLRCLVLALEKMQDALPRGGDHAIYVRYWSGNGDKDGKKGRR